MTEGLAGLFPEPARGSGPEPRPSLPVEPGTRPARPPAGRSHRGALVGLAVGVLAAGAGVAVASGVLDVGPPGATPTPETVVLPSPTPTVPPAARQPVTPFADALPSTVLAYALTSLAQDSSLLVAGALEAYRLDYSDGGGGTITVVAGQWPSAEEATAALAAATAGGSPVDDGEAASGEVVVAEAPAGTWTLTQAADGSISLSWTNGTALLRAFGAGDVLRDVFAAYPL